MTNRCYERSTGFQPVLSAPTDNRSASLHGHLTRAGKGSRRNTGGDPCPCYNKAPWTSGHPRRGTVLIVALWIIIIFTGLVLVFAQTMRVEAITSANCASAIQAAEVERAAEQFVLAQIDENSSTPGQVLTLTDATWQAVQVGNGYFWIIRPNYGDPQMSSFGLVDEASKVNLNCDAVLQNKLLHVFTNLPAMPPDGPDNILTWRGMPAGGADDSYYMSLPNPYQCKGSPSQSAKFESVEELLLIQDMTLQVLYGQSPTGAANQVSPWSTNTNLPFGLDPGTAWGLYNYVTVYSRQVPSASAQRPFPINNINAENRVQLRERLAAALNDPNRARDIVRTILPNGIPTATFNDVFEFAVLAQLRPSELPLVIPNLTTSSKAARGQQIIGRINVNTAPREVLASLWRNERLSYLSDAEVSSLMSYRASGNNLNNIAWVAAALGTEKAIGLGNLITTRPHQYSADIVAVSGDGRAFKRCRIVVDTLGSPTGNVTSATPTPLAIVYRKDLTQTGWPMDPSILSSLRSGNGLPPAAYSSQTGSLLQ